MKLSFIQLFLIVAILITLNLISSGFFYRWDLTAERRYSISQVSQQTADSLESVLTVKVYLEGDFPAPLKRFADAVRTTLIELKVYAGSNLQYKFINPGKNPDLMKLFNEHGISPLPVNVRTSEMESSRQYVFPVAVVSYQGKDEYVDLIKGSSFPNGQVDLIRAEQDIEYKLVSAIKRLMTTEPRIVGLLRGQREFNRNVMAEWIQEMSQFYTILDVRADSGQSIAPSKRFLPDTIAQKLAGRGVDVLVVAQPDTAFSERTKYEIDQYLMRGGRILWIVDQEKVDVSNGPSLSIMRQLNLDDLFFKYGFKINYDLVQDVSCGRLDVIRGFNDGPVWSSEKWLYYPAVYNLPDHPINRNIDGLLLRYVSTIDTIPRNGVKFTPFVFTSAYSRTLNGNVMIDLNKELTNPPPVEVFRYKGNKVVGLQLDGKFESLFAGRTPPVDTKAPNPPTAKFIAQNIFPTEMLVVSDGQIALPEDYRGRPGTMPLDNKTFLMNCLDLLMGNQAITQIRAKEVSIKQLHKETVVQNKILIQLLNVLFPVILILLFGIARHQLRVRENQKKAVIT
ncbi:MAG: gliding motility-associated ABC transporter substrate-binding protein GldG [Bacteroidia bacterium]|nr:gliding motility-associated ABC transporter substrate-binding protein GldG [Bacteroidia bacterium]